MQKLVLLSTFLVITSCGKPLPNLEGIDLAVWKADKTACKGERSKFIESIASQRDQLKALSEMDIIKLLGRPDLNELYTRNQKFYKYYLEPGPSCEHRKDKPKELVIRFNAMGLAKEVSVE